MKMTEHAKTRCQQRGIKPHLLELIIQFGKKSFLPGGATGYLLRKKDKKRLVQELDHIEGIQVVESPEGSIITAYHRS